MESITIEQSELTARARELAPLLRSHAEWIDANGCMPTEVVQALEQNGLFRLAVPRQYGGLEASARAWADVCSELAQGCISVGWVFGVYTIQDFMLSLWPDETLNEVYSSPDVRVCGLGPPTAGLEKVDGGYLLSGKWPFTSGAKNSDWKMSAARGPDGDSVLLMTPIGDLILHEDWQTIGMSGTGSITVEADNVFVPEHLAMRTADHMVMACQSQANQQKPLYATPRVVMAVLSLAGVYTGAGRAVIREFVARLPGRAISHTDYELQELAPMTHLQVGEAAMLVEEAELRLAAFCSFIDNKTELDEQWSVEDRIWCRAQGGRIAGLSKRACDILASASGGSSIYEHVAISRMNRDIQAMARHAMYVPDVNTELYGRQILGLAPNTHHY